MKNEKKESLSEREKDTSANAISKIMDIRSSLTPITGKSKGIKRADNSLEQAIIDLALTIWQSDR